jgi:hypothetical protein
MRSSSASLTLANPRDEVKRREAKCRETNHHCDLSTPAVRFATASALEKFAKACGMQADEFMERSPIEALCA